MPHVYVLKDTNGEVRYVGRTSKDLNKRLSQHISSSHGSNTHKSLWVKSILRNGGCPVIESVHYSESDCVHEEIGFMDYYTRLGCKLTNTAPGGFGGQGSRSRESIDRGLATKRARGTDISGTMRRLETIRSRGIKVGCTTDSAKKSWETRRANGTDRGFHQTQDARNRIGNSLRGRKKTEETKKLMSENNAGRKINKEDVVWIRTIGQPLRLREISKILGISMAQISLIKNRKSWTHV